MTEEEKFWEEAEKRAQELKKMKRENESKYEKLKYELVKKYVKMFGEDLEMPPVWGVSEFKQIAWIDVAIKMGKSVYEITGAKYDPNVTDY